MFVQRRNMPPTRGFSSSSEESAYEKSACRPFSFYRNNRCNRETIADRARPFRQSDSDCACERGIQHRSGRRHDRA
jgi:hypothetical protein